MRQGKPHRADDRDLMRLGIRELSSFNDVRRRVAEIVEGILVTMVQHTACGACSDEKKKSQEVVLFSPDKNFYPLPVIRVVISKSVHTLLRISMHQERTLREKREKAPLNCYYFPFVP